MSTSTQQTNMLYVATSTAEFFIKLPDDEFDDRGNAATIIAEARARNPTIPVYIFSFPKHTLEEQSISDKFWNDLVGKYGSYQVFENEDRENGVLHDALVTLLQTIPEDKPGVMFVTGKFDSWLAPQERRASITTTLAGGGYNPKDCTAKEMVQISDRDGRTYYIDHTHQVNGAGGDYKRHLFGLAKKLRTGQTEGSELVDAEQKAQELEKRAKAINEFRCISQKELDEFKAQAGWDAAMRVAGIAIPHQGFIHTDNFTKKALLKDLSQANLIGKKLSGLPGFEKNAAAIELWRTHLVSLVENLPEVTREDLVNGTGNAPEFCRLWHAYRAFLRMGLQFFFPEGEWKGKFFSVKSSLAERLMRGEPDVPLGDFSIGFAISNDYHHMFFDSRRNFLNKQVGKATYKSALVPEDGKYVGNFWTLEFMPHLPIEERVQLYGVTFMKWWVEAMQRVASLYGA